MAFESANISVLIVDADEFSLAILANVLIAWKFKVLTATSARDALETLREFEGFFDLVISELDIPGMSGFEFQKRVKNEFQLPLIMMSSDNRKNVISKSIQNGAASYILKPFCPNDFNKIWQCAMVARKEKLVIENEMIIRSREGKSLGEKKIVFQDVINSHYATTSSSLVELKGKGKYNYKRKRSSVEDQSGGKSRATKKPKMVWTTYLHNLFLLAIKQIGFEKAVPKKIVEVMNVPNLTRENVASHLQKYRIFLRKVAEKILVEGLISDKVLRSKFASSLPMSVIRDIQTRTHKRVPMQQHYLERLSYQTRNYASKSFNHVSSNNNYVSTTQLERGDQFPYPLHKYDSWINQVRLGQSSFGSNMGPANKKGRPMYETPTMWGLTANNNINQNMLGISYATRPYHQANLSYNAGATFPTYERGQHGLMTSTKVLTGGLKYGDTMTQNHGSIGNHNFSNGLGNWNMGSLYSSNVLPQASTYINPNSNPFGIQLNDGTQMVGTMNNNSLGFNNGAQIANMNNIGASLGDENFGLFQGLFGVDSVSSVGDGDGTEIPGKLITTENVSRITQLPQQEHDGNVVKNKHQNDNATSFSVGEVNKVKDDPLEHFLMLDDMNILNEMAENPNESDFSNSDSSNSWNIVPSLEQFNKAGDAIILPAKSTPNLPNESPTSSNENSIQLQGDYGFVDNVSSASTSTTEQDWDMELIEALFGTVENCCFKDHYIR